MREGFARDLAVLSGVTRDEGVFSTNLKRKGGTLDDLVENVKEHFASTCYLMDGDIDCLRHTPAEARDRIADEVVQGYQQLSERFSCSPPEARERCVDLGMRKVPKLADDNYELAVKILGDHDFMLAHMMTAWALSQHRPVYAYVFSDGSDPAGRFAGHGADQSFLFGTDALIDNRRPGAEPVSSLIMEAWASFARTGDPSTPELGEWPPVSFPTPGSPGATLPDVPSAWEHMNIEHGRTGVVSYGGEEVGLWFRAAAQLAELLGNHAGGRGLRQTTQAMSVSLYGARPHRP